MKRFLLAVVTTAALAVFSVGSATAAPSEVSATFGPKAQFVSPTTILLPVTVTCPESYVSSFPQASVSQEATGGIGFGGVSVPCTGEPETAVIVVSGGPFTLGSAVASGFAFAGVTFDQDIRRIQITL